MSIIIGMETKDDIWIGNDSAASTEEEVRVRRDPKMFYNNKILIGAAGNVRTIQMLLPDNWDCPDISNINQFVQALYAHLKEITAIAYREELSCEVADINLIVVWNKQLYEIGIDLSVAEYRDGYTAIGSGKYYALGSLFSTHDMMLHPKEKVRLALRATAFFCPSVVGPFSIKKLPK